MLGSVDRNSFRFKLPIDVKDEIRSWFEEKASIGTLGIELVNLVAGSLKQPRNETASNRGETSLNSIESSSAKTETCFSSKASYRSNYGNSERAAAQEQLSYEHKPLKDVELVDSLYKWEESSAAIFRDDQFNESKIKQPKKMLTV